MRLIGLFAGFALAQGQTVESSLEILHLQTGERRVVHRAAEHFEAPNWTPDGKTLIFNGGGKLWRIPVAGGKPEQIPAGDVRANNDHGISPDGKWLIVSGSSEGKPSRIFVLPIEGGTPRLVTPNAPSYWHGISPDGKTLVYCAQRNGEFDIYSIPFEGGPETRLTDTPGLDDGPEFSPDGRWIYFNSVRSGLMRIWRMRPDGSGAEMVSKGPPSADWFAHPSPDGKWIVYLSYDPSVTGHPPNKEVTLQIAMPDGSDPRVVVKLFGGQGTINVPSWSPDSREFAFVSYRLLNEAPSK
jgi:Tol biopolymer transport system component